MDTHFLVFPVWFSGASIRAAFLTMCCAGAPSCAAPDAPSTAPASDATTNGPDSAADAGARDSAQDEAESIPAMRSEIVDHSLWRRLDAKTDPFGDWPEEITCDPSATLAELFNGVSAYGIDTGLCNYTTLHQPTLRVIAAGETITVRLAHFDLTAPEDSEAHVVVQVDDLPIVAERIPIPSRSQVLVRSVLAPRPVPAGASVYFHVHNHGANSYALISISAGRQVREEQR